MVYSTPSGWTVQYCNHRAKKEVAAMAEDMRAEFVRISQMIEEYGLENMREPQIKPLEGKIWEMRMRGRDGIARAAYITASGIKSVCFALLCEKDPTNATGRNRVSD